jgi:Mg2+/Co2+ transporter CorC
MKQLGRMPRRGETITIGIYEFRVMRSDRRRIDSLRVTIPPQFHSAAPAE